MIERADIPSFQLGKLSAYLGLKVEEEKCHGSLYDAHLARNIYYKLLG
jgi:hypothetical protein